MCNIYFYQTIDGSKQNYGTFVNSLIYKGPLKKDRVHAANSVEKRTQIYEVYSYGALARIVTDIYNSQVGKESKIK